MNKQYFDFLELEGRYIRAAGNESGRKTPLNFTCIGYILSLFEDMNLKLNSLKVVGGTIRAKLKTEN